jgi:hypothetical protein
MTGAGNSDRVREAIRRAVTTVPDPSEALRERLEEGRLEMLRAEALGDLPRWEHARRMMFELLDRDREHAGVTASADRVPRRLPGLPTDPGARGGQRRVREELAGPERLLLAIAALDADPRTLDAAAALIATLDLAARERVIGAERS